MAPVRKKSKLATEAPLPQDDNQSDPNTTLQQDQGEATSSSRDDVTSGGDLAALSRGDGDISRPAATNRSSWYAGGSWRSKASPVAQVARESISVEQGVSSESSNLDEVTRRPSQSVSKSFRGSRKSVPLVAEATRVHVTSDVSDKSFPPKGHLSSEEKLKGVQPPISSESKPIIDVIEDAPLPPEPQPAMADGSDADTKSVETARTQPGPWFGWWSRPDGYGSDGEKGKSVNKQSRLNGAAEEATSTPLPGSPIAEDTDPLKKGDAIPTVGENGTGSSTDPSKFETGTTTSSRSWFRLWSSVQNEQATEEEQQGDKAVGPNMTKQADAIPPIEPSSTVDSRSKKEQATTKGAVKDEEQPKSSGWAFWSADRTKEPAPGSSTKQIGELAVADTPSQSHPEAAQFNQEREANKSRAIESKLANTLLKPKRGRPEKTKESSSDTTAVSTPAESQLQTPIDTPEASPAPVQRGKRPQTRPNLILPTFRETYPTAPSHGYIERLTQYLAQTLHIPGSEALPRPPHPYITSTPPKVRKAIAIGVHGFFPAALLQKVLGQPTGTSIRFANYAAASIKQWCQEHQPEIKEVEIEKVALEGEGVIADRISTLWKLLLNWLSHLRQADFILVAAHSQGVPVAITLVAKLIQLGALSPHVRIGICAMAGINLGPFIEYKSRLFGGSALELFDFCESSSKVSVAYSEALEVCLRHGVRVTFTGSLDDQLVSLESSLHSPLVHPYVSRTLFIDGRLHAPSFLTHLVIFAVKLRNLGVSDHGLLRELSGPLAGSLVGGEGHSRVYDDPAVYQMAIEHALETTDVLPSDLVSPPTGDGAKDKERGAAVQRRASLSGYPSSMIAANHMRRGSGPASSFSVQGIAPTIAPYEVPGAVGSAEKNPFVLPWAVRGMLEEELVKRDPKMQAEVKELVEQFENWRPVSKVLKDVRWRLEGVRSML